MNDAASCITGRHGDSVGTCCYDAAGLGFPVGQISAASAAQSMWGEKWPQPACQQPAHLRCLQRVGGVLGECLLLFLSATAAIQLHTHTIELISVHWYIYCEKLAAPHDS